MSCACHRIVCRRHLVEANVKPFEEVTIGILAGQCNVCGATGVAARPFALLPAELVAPVIIEIMSRPVSCSRCRAHLGQRKLYAPSVRRVTCFCGETLELPFLPDSKGPVRHDLRSSAFDPATHCHDCGSRPHWRHASGLPLCRACVEKSGGTCRTFDIDDLESVVGPEMLARILALPSP